MDNIVTHRANHCANLLLKNLCLIILDVPSASTAITRRMPQCTLPNLHCMTFAKFVDFSVSINSLHCPDIYSIALPHVATLKTNAQTKDEGQTNDVIIRMSGNTKRPTDSGQTGFESGTERARRRWPAASTATYLPHIQRHPSRNQRSVGNPDDRVQPGILVAAHFEPAVFDGAVPAPSNQDVGSVLGLEHVSRFGARFPGRQPRRNPPRSAVPSLRPGVSPAGSAFEARGVFSPRSLGPANEPPVMGMASRVALIEIGAGNVMLTVYRNVRLGGFGPFAMAMAIIVVKMMAGGSILALCVDDSICLEVPYDLDRIQHGLFRPR